LLARGFPIGLYHPLDGVTNPRYKLLYFVKTKKICKEKKALAFYRDRCCHLALCLWLILFHKDLLFGLMDLDLSTPVSYHPSLVKSLHSLAALQHAHPQKHVCK
jgi:hypothetical protein